jgi:hypothetical protein
MLAIFAAATATSYATTNIFGNSKNYSSNSNFSAAAVSAAAAAAVLQQQFYNCPHFSPYEK